MRKTCIISNIVLSVIYVVSSWFVSILGYLLLFGSSSGKVFPEIFYFTSSVLLMGTPIFCIIGIVLSVIFRKKEKYKWSLSIQFLPFATILLSICFLLFSMLLGA